MELLCVGLVSLLVCFADSELEIRDPVVYDPEADWNRISEPERKDLVRAGASQSVITNSSILPEAKRVPLYLIVSSSNDPKEAFKPEKGARNLPGVVKTMLFQALAATTPPLSGGGKKSPLEVRCHINRIYVRIKKAMFKTSRAFKNLKLGTCPVNKIYGPHFYFLYPLTAECGFRTESNADYFTVKIMLRYGSFGPVIRDVPFQVNIHCKYPRFFHSYKVGIRPKVQGGTIHKYLKRCFYILIIKDENGNEIKGNYTMPLGKMLYFETKRAEGTGSSEKGRMYIDNCYLTNSKSPSSKVKYYVIEKGGCMMDSMASTNSKFLPFKSKSVQKFVMPAIVLNDSLSSPIEQHLFMHCEASWGPEKATEGQKACNYDLQAKKWKELYDDDSVCACCDFGCSKNLRSSNSNIVTSQAWKVNWHNHDDVDLDIGLEYDEYDDVDP